MHWTGRNGQPCDQCLKSDLESAPPQHGPSLLAFVKLSFRHKPSGVADAKSEFRPLFAGDVAVLRIQHGDTRVFVESLGGVDTRVHLDRLVELECVAIRHGRLGSQFVYELLLDLDAPEAVAHVGLIDVEKLREGYNNKVAGGAANLAGLSRGVAGSNGHLAGGGVMAPPAENATPAASEPQPDGLAGSHIRRPAPGTALL